jgi:molecular chaperone GrpE (heat shock protein)
MIRAQPIHRRSATPSMTANCCGVPTMRSRSRSSAAGVDAYGPQAQIAAAVAESNLRAAAARRAERDADLAATKAAEIAERERALAAREEQIRALEQRLEDSRRRLQARLQTIQDRRSAPRSEFRLPRVDNGYFDAGSNADEDEWWARQLGKQRVHAAA